MKRLCVLSLFAAFFAAQSRAQTVCNSVPSRATVQTDVMNRGGVGTSEVIYTCRSYADYNQKIFDAMTAYSERYYLDYACNSTAGWFVQAFMIDVGGSTPSGRDAGTCKRCFQAASAPGHCEPCPDQCYICTSDLCYVCDDGYSLAAGNICQTDTYLSGGIIAVIVVCVVLAIIFVVLLIAACGLIVYIAMFTKTEEIAHRRMKDDRNPVTYQRRSQIGTFRQNPVFGNEGPGWSSQDQQQPEGGWSNPLAQPKSKRPPLTSLETEEKKQDSEEDSEASYEEDQGDGEDGGYEI